MNEALSSSIDTPLPFWMRISGVVKPSLKPRTVMFALAICLALQTTSYVLIMPLFSRRLSALGAGVEALSLSDLAYAVTATLAAPLMGALADRIGRRPLALTSLAVYIGAFTGYLLAPSAGVFIALRALAGAFTAGLAPAIYGIIADLAPEKRRAQWISIVCGGSSFGWIAGPLVGGLLYDRWGYEVPFILAIALASLALLTAFITVSETRSAEAARPALGLKNLLPSPRALRSALPSSLPTFGILLAVSFGELFAWAFIEPQAMFYVYDGLGWTSSQLGLAMSVYGVALMVGELTLGGLSDRWGRKPVLVLGLALFTAQFAGLFLFREYLLITLSFGLAGLGNALFDPALSAFILDITPMQHKSTVMGLKSTAGSLGNVLGPALLILFTPFLQPQGIFLIATLSVVLLAAGCACLLKKPLQ
jgi:MFS family permease